MPQFNFQPIYSKYAGNNAATVDKLLTKKEEEYKVGEQYMDAYDKLRKSMQAAENLTGDVAAVDDLSKKAIDDIKQFAEKGDYENLYNKIKGSVIDLQAKYTPYSQNKEKYYEDIKNINTQKDWSPNEKASFIAKKTEEYNSGKGLQVDPITGQATGFISMGKMADYYNAQKELMDFTSKITINEGYNEGGFRAEKNPDGTYSGYDSRRNTEWKSRTLEEIKEIGKQYILSSPEIMASLNQKAELDAYNTIKSVDDPKQLLAGINQDIDDKIKAYTSQDDKKLTKDKIKEKYNAIQDLKNSKIDINTANPQQVIQNLKLNKAINNDTYNVADALEVNSVKSKTDFIKNLQFDALASAAEKRMNATKDIMVNANNRDITPEDFAKNYRELNKEQSTLVGNFESGSKQIFNSGVDADKRDRILYDVRKLKITGGGYSQKDFEKVQAIFNAEGIKYTANDIQNRINIINRLAEQKKVIDNNNSQINRFNKQVSVNIPDNKIKAIQKLLTGEGKDERYSFTESDVKEMIKGNLLGDNSYLYKYIEKHQDKGNGVKISSSRLYEAVHNRLQRAIAKEGIKVDPKTLQVQRYGFTNPEENSLTGDFNSKVTNAINVGGIHNFNSNNKSVEALFNNGEIPDESGNKAAPTTVKATYSMPITDNQMLVTFESGEGKDKRIFKVPIDIKKDGSNVFSYTREYHVESARNMPYGKKEKYAETESYNDAQKGHIISVANMDIEDKDKINIENMPINTSDVIDAGAYRFKITKKRSGYEAKIIKTVGKNQIEESLPRADGDDHNVILYPSYDDLMFSIGKVLVGFSN
jgi:hypothetical protein